MQTPRLAIAAITTAGLLALAACGSSGSTNATTNAAPAVSAASASPVAVTSGNPASTNAASASAAPTTAAPTTSAPATSAAAPSATLPDGTATILPGHRVVALYGTAVTPPDNALPDAGTPQQAAVALAAKEKPFAAGGEPVLGAFELIATIIQAAPGPTGSHASDLDLSTIQKYEDAAVKNHLLLVLDIQPGTDHYLPHVKRLAKFLAMPNVSIALDPEWQFLTGGYQDMTGSSPASEINTVSAYLSQFTQSHNLPQKLFVLHQFTTMMITDRSEVKNEPGLATVMHIDGIGNGGNAGKIGDYKVLHGGKGQFSGFKLFLKEDTDLMTPAQVLALSPKPDLITYQ